MEKNRQVKIVRLTLKYGLIIIGLFLSLVILFLLAAYSDFKAAASNALAGKSALVAAADSARKADWARANISAQDAQSYFSESLDDIARTRTNPAIKYLGLIRSQVDDLEYLLSTAEILSRSMAHLLPVVADIDSIRQSSGHHYFTELSDSDKTRFLQKIYESEPELTGLKGSLELATLNLDKIHRIGVLWPAYSRISQLNGELKQVLTLMNRISPAIKLLPAFAGYPSESRFLLVMQNNDELRPTGGFIGVYGILEIKNGQIISMATDDSYHLDMPASQSAAWKLEPPTPLKKYLKVEKWYLRDANWSPDWPTSAANISRIFRGESEAIGQPVPEFTGVVAINPDFVADLIGLVGPVTVKGTTYDVTNFQPLLQYNVEVAYKDQNIASWDRKEIINDVVKELESRLFSLPADKWLALSDLIDRNIVKRNVQMYFSPSDREELAGGLGVKGDVRQTDGDYLMVVDSNLAAFKTDAVVKKNIFYAVNENPAGLNATVKLAYRHEGGFDWRTTRYRSYTRLLTPLGSRLITIQGVDQSNADISVTDDPALGKTVIGFFFTVEPGSAKEISLEYRLPSVISEQAGSGAYHLLVQKQSGSRHDNLSVKLNKTGAESKSWSTDFQKDKSFTQ